MERMAKMDDKMKTMRELRDKMMAAKSAEERGALMAQAMTAMQADMPMMGGQPMMGGMGGMGMGMGAKGGMGAKAAGKSTSGMGPGMMLHHQMMDKRMEMMETMMQMMLMDRAPAPAAPK
jgi:hypothetical protein